MGVELKREATGKLFPRDGQARTVLQALLARAGKVGVSLCPGHRVHEVSVSPSCFEIRHQRGMQQAARLILATGGRSLPKSGSDGHGYRWPAHWDMRSRGRSPAWCRCGSTGHPFMPSCRGFPRRWN